MPMAYPLTKPALFRDLTLCLGVVARTKARQVISYAPSGLNFRYWCLAITSLVLSACGDSAPAVSTYSIGGTVLSANNIGVTITVNGSDVAVSPNKGQQTFGRLASNTRYGITVPTQAQNTAQTCTVTNGTGTVSNANINDVVISCAPNEYAIGGTVSGLTGTGLTVQTNGGDAAPLSTNGSHIFATQVSGSSYAIRVLNQPSNPAQTCTVSGGSGTVEASDISDIAITCGTIPYLTASQFANKTLRGFSGSGDTSTQSMTDMASTGANLARQFLLLNQSGDSYSIDETSFNALDAVVAAGAKLGFKVVICLSPPDNSYFNDPSLQASIDVSWKIIAKKYLGNVTVAGYDLINEPISPNPGGAAAWTSLASEWITDIRQIDPDHVVIFEPTPGGIPSAFSGLKPLPFTNIVYSSHVYGPYEFSHQGLLFNTAMNYPTATSSIGAVNRATVSSALQPIRDFVTSYHFPVYVGEFSAVRWAPNDSSNTYVTDLISLFEAEGYSWTYHAWRAYQGWDAEILESMFYSFPFVNAKPTSFGAAWPPPRADKTDTMNALERYFQANTE
jgi:endoglucanase